MAKMMLATANDIPGSQQVAGISDLLISDWPALKKDEDRSPRLQESQVDALLPGRFTCLHQLIEDQAERTPDHAAVAFEDQKIGFRDLCYRANCLASKLRKMGAGPDVLVGLFLERSIETVIAIVGILKAGAAYVPIDTSFPADRVRFILEDAGVRLLVTQRSLLHHLNADRLQPICVDEFDWSAVQQPLLSPPSCRLDNLAYVIYTSGSTGRPKGVAIEHRNIVNYVIGISERMNFEPGMNHAMVSTIAADLGNTVLFPALVTGGCLHVISQDMAKSQSELSDYFEREKIDVLKIVPSHLAALQSGKHPERVMPRKRLILGGEASRLEWVQELRILAPDCEIYNHYGPTETTVGVLTYHVGKQLPVTHSGTLPLGKPLPNIQIHILDENGQPTPDGTEGEIYVSGTGVARGYLNHVDLTEQRFLPDRFSKNSNGRMYRTGDLGRCLPGGDIEFCGRFDDQVKIHGFRIELGEIECALREMSGVKEALVLARDDGRRDKVLVAYLIPKRQNQPLWRSKNLHILPNGLQVAQLNLRETDKLYAQIFIDQPYFRHGINIGDGDCVVDLGANIGLFGIYASRSKKNVRMICIETDPAAFACLKANASAYDSSIECLQLDRNEESLEAEFFGALARPFDVNGGSIGANARAGTTVGKSALSEDDEFVCATGVVADNQKTRDSSNSVQSLQDIIAEQRIERVHLLRVHATQYELSALEQLRIQEWAKIDQVVIDTHDHQDVEPTASLLRRHGFSVTVQRSASPGSDASSFIYGVRGPERSFGSLELSIENSGTHPWRAADAQIISPQLLRKGLQERLPHQMVPTAFVLIDHFPLTANGKIDRNALPEFSVELAQSSHEVIGPSNPTERLLAEIWTELLKVERVGIHDNFFDLGGHSLLAIKAASRIRDAFEVNLPAQIIFRNSTVAELAKVISQQSPSQASSSRIQRRDHSGPSRLSSAEEQLWFVSQLTPQSPFYNVVDVIPLGETYQANALHRALNELVRRHEVLRTTFSVSDGKPVRTVLPTLGIALDEADLSLLPASERAKEWTRVVQEQGRSTFTLSKAPLFRAKVIHWSPREHRLLFVIHHIIADEWGMEVVQREIRHLYHAFIEGLPSSLPELPIQYADFAAWQQDWLQGEEVKEQIAYWRKELAGAPHVLDLSPGKTRPAVQSFRGATEHFELSPKLLSQLKALGRAEQATSFMVLIASFVAFLHRLTGQDDLLVGTPISGRVLAETENLVGCFLNNIVVRGQISQDTTFRSLLRQIRTRALAGYSHADLPFKSLVAELSPERDLSRSPLFQSMFILHDTGGLSEVSKVAGKHQLQTGTSKFDLTLSMTESEDHLEALIEYSTDLFDAESIRRMCEHFTTLLEAIACDPDEKVSQLPMLLSSERIQLLQEWNRFDDSFRNDDCCLHQLIEQRVRLTPDRIAVASGHQKLTYLELDSRSNQVANYLRRNGIGPDVLVGVSFQRSIDMIVAVLGVLKAGGAYVPLDPSYPQNRLAYMVEDSGMKTLLTHRGLEKTLAVRPHRIIRMDSNWSEIAGESTKAPDSSDSTTSDLAYVLYTSGSTGKPKGVAIPHSAIVNFLLSMQMEPGFTSDDTLLAVTTLSFDIAALELYLPLISGGTVVIASDEEIHDPAQLITRIEDSACTMMQATPATWRGLLNVGWKGLPTLRILCGGEPMSSDLARELLSLVPEVWNMYGPTETTVWSTLHRVTSAEEMIPIGKPIANTQVYVLDGLLNLVPIGGIGELYIGGRGLARGYLYRNDLTKERFIPSPFTDDALLYKTGDLARWRQDGILECLGRADSQIKLRGFRIEAGEIEAVLQSHRGIRHCAVIAREDEPGNKQLVAYYESREGTALSFADLRAYVAKDLPSFMVPSSFVQIDKLPLTPNGKVDRRSLPKPAESTAEGTNFVAPRDTVEQVLAQIWSKILRVSRIGLHDNFFELGGHSLLAVRIAVEIEKLTGFHTPLATFLHAPTIAQLAEVLRKEHWEPSWNSLVPLRGSGSRPPLFLIHAHGGNVLEYHPLAKLLDSDQPVYALQARGLDGTARPGLTLEKMASDYLAEIRTLQPQGPYFLAGFCFGGLVALEMAHQLKRAGEQVALLVLIQSTHPAVFRFRPDIPSPLRWWYRLRKRYDLEKENRSSARKGYVWRRLLHAGDLILARLCVVIDSSIGNGRSKTWRMPKLFIYERLRKEHSKALVKYTPRTYDGNAVLFRASKQLRGFMADECLGWKGVLNGGFEICELPGHQQNMLLEPNVRRLAREIDERLLNARRNWGLAEDEDQCATGCLGGPSYAGK